MNSLLFCAATVGGFEPDSSRWPFSTGRVDNWPSSRWQFTLRVGRLAVGTVYLFLFMLHGLVLDLALCWTTTRDIYILWWILSWMMRMYVMDYGQWICMWCIMDGGCVCDGLWMCMWWNMDVYVIYPVLCVDIYMISLFALMESKNKKIAFFSLCRVPHSAKRGKMFFFIFCFPSAQTKKSHIYQHTAHDISHTHPYSITYTSITHHIHIHHP